MTNLENQLGYINNNQVIAKRPNEEYGELIDKNKINDYNQRGYNIFQPANDFKEGKIKIKNMVWKFSFASQKDKNLVNGDITTRDFWMDQFKNNENVKESFKNALGRKRGWYKQLAVVITGLDVYIVLCLDENELQYLKNDVYKKYYKLVSKKLNIILKKNSKKIPLTSKKIEDPLSVIMPKLKTRHTKTKGDSDKVLISKSFDLLIKIKTFKRTLKSLFPKSNYKTILSDKHNSIDIKKLFKIRPKRQNVLAGKAAYGAKQDLFWKKYKRQLFLDGKKGVQRWLVGAINRFFNLKAPILKNYGISEPQKVESKIIEVSKGFKWQNKEKQNNECHIGIGYEPENFYYELNNIAFESENIKLKDTGKIITPEALLKKIILSGSLKEVGFRRKAFLDYWDKNPQVKNAMFVFWYKDCLGIRLSKKENKKFTDNPQVEDSIGNCSNLRKKQGDSLMPVVMEEAIQTWTNFIGLFRGGQFAQERTLKKAGVSEKNIRKMGGMSGWLFFDLKDIKKIMGIKSRKTLKKMENKFLSSSNLQLKHSSKHLDSIENIKLLDFIHIGRKKELLELKKEGHIQAPLKKDWFTNSQRRYVCLKISDEFYQKEGLRKLSTTSCITKNYFSMTLGAKNMLLYIVGKAKTIQGSYRRRNNYKQTDTKRIYLKKMLDIKGNPINIHTARKQLNELKEKGSIKDFTLTNNGELTYKLNE